MDWRCGSSGRVPLSSSPSPTKKKKNQAIRYDAIDLGIFLTKSRSAMLRSSNLLPLSYVLRVTSFQLDTPGYCYHLSALIESLPQQLSAERATKDSWSQNGPTGMADSEKSIYSSTICSLPTMYKTALPLHITSLEDSNCHAVNQGYPYPLSKGIAIHRLCLAVMSQTMTWGYLQGW
jgi:hypothetical protein